MGKEIYNDDQFYRFSDQEFDLPKNKFEYESLATYDVPFFEKYSYQEYDKYFSKAEKDADFVWYPSQKNKLTEAEFNQIKRSIQELEADQDPSHTENSQRQRVLENQILLNGYQFFSYQAYLRACKILLEVGVRPYSEVIYNPPLDQEKFMSEKQRILRIMVKEDWLTPTCMGSGNTIFPDSWL